MLNTLKNNFGSKKKRMRVGRGIGSGKGKTCGRGGKGQTARSGVAVNGFEGGQNPLYRRLPKRGFNSLNKCVYFPINLSSIELLVSTGKLDPSNIDYIAMLRSGLIRNLKTKVKILGTLSNSIVVNIKAHSVSEAARSSIGAHGGVLELE